MARGEQYVTTPGEWRKQTLYVECWVIHKEHGAHTVVPGTILTLHQGRFGWMMFTVLVMNRASRRVDMADGEVTIAPIGKM